MTIQVSTIIEPFIQRGLFESPEKAVIAMARDYVLRQVERYQAVIAGFQHKYGMEYEQFEDYLKARSATLATIPDIALNQEIMAEEEDALDWKIACDMLANWLGIQVQVDEGGA
jgi:hypothetical protein